MFEIIQLCLTYAAMHKFCACYQSELWTCVYERSTFKIICVTVVAYDCTFVLSKQVTAKRGDD